MATLELALPDATIRWIGAQTRGGRYDNASSYVRDLIRRDQLDREALARLQAAINPSRSSGLSDRTADEILLAACIPRTPSLSRRDRVPLQPPPQPARRLPPPAEPRLALPHASYHLLIDHS